MISLAAGCLLDAGPRHTLLAAAQAGYDAVGLRLEGDDRTIPMARSLRTMADDLGLAILDVEVARLGPGISLSEHLELLDLAAELDASFVLTVSHHENPQQSLQEWGVLAEAGVQRGLGLALEFMAFTAVQDLSAAREMATTLGGSEAGVHLLLDALHLQRAGGTPADVAALPPGLVGYLQLCDGPSQGPETIEGLIDEARGNRLAPGAGELDLGALLDAADPGLPLSVEVQSRALRQQFPPLERAVHLLTQTHSVLAARNARVPTHTPEV